MSERSRLEQAVELWHGLLRTAVRLLMGLFVVLSSLAMVAILGLGLFEIFESIAGPERDPWVFAPLIGLILVLTIYIAILDRFSPALPGRKGSGH